MKNFKILNSPKESCYFGEDLPINATGEEQYYYDIAHFYESSEVAFLNELKKHADIKKQAGYSTLKECDYLSLILIFHNSGDGEFCGHSIKSTCLINKDNHITDSNNYCNVHDEVGHSIGALYHQLPDGKLVEYQLEETYENNLQNIYDSIKKIRYYYELNLKFPEKLKSTKINKI